MKSLLFVPGHSEKYLKSAFMSNAHAIIFDLEDAVPAGSKDVARGNLAFLKKLRSQSEKKVIIRLNEFSGVELEKDLICLENEDFFDFLMPVKCRAIEELRSINEVIKKPQIPLVETAYGLAFCNDIALEEYVRGLALGAEDLMDDLGVKSSGYDDMLLHSKTVVSIAAKLGGISCLDTPFLGLDDLDGYSLSCRASYGLGFSGRLCIHPSQIDFTNQYYYPSPEERSFALEIKKKLDEARESGYSVIRWKGELVGPPMVKRALSILKEMEND